MTHYFIVQFPGPPAGGPCAIAAVCFSHEKDHWPCLTHGHIFFGREAKKKILRGKKKYLAQPDDVSTEALNYDPCRVDWPLYLSFFFFFFLPAPPFSLLLVAFMYSVSSLHPRFSRMVSWLRVGERSAGEREPRQVTQVTLGWRAGGFAVRTVDTGVSRGSQKGKHRSCSVLFFPPQGIKIYTTLTAKQEAWLTHLCRFILKILYVFWIKEAGPYVIKVLRSIFRN